MSLSSAAGAKHLNENYLSDPAWMSLSSAAGAKHLNENYLSDPAWMSFDIDRSCAFYHSRETCQHGFDKIKAS
jgi:hypothetical protein